MKSVLKKTFGKDWYEKMCLCLIIMYLIAVLMAQLIGLGYLLKETIILQEPYKLWVTCALIGGVGGVIYCMRGMYLNYCVNKKWNRDWWLWYLLRPIVSFVMGAVSYIFLRAGLIFLSPTNGEDLNQWTFYALGPGV